MIINKIRKKINSDSGASITIIMIFMIVLIIMIAGFIVDFTRNQSIKNEYYNIAQRSTQSALVKQNSTGGLGPQSAYTAVNEYIQERNDNNATFFMGKSSSNLTTKNGVIHSYDTKNNQAYPRIRILYSKDRSSVNLNNNEWLSLLNSGSTSTNTALFPITTTLYTPDENINTWYSNNNSMLGQLNQKNYKVIYIVSEDISSNMFFGTANFSGNTLGDSYQHYTIKVNSVAVNSNNQ